MKEQIALQHALKARLGNIRIRYPNYSIRAFAKKAGVSPATMSLILQGKRPVSAKLASKLSERFQFDPQERAEVFNSTLSKKKKQATDSVSPEYIQLSIDQYRVVSDWRAFAILNLLKTKDFQSDTAWISDRLGIAEEETKETVDRLERLGMLDIENGVFKRSVSKYRTTEDVANLSLRKSHQQTLELAAASLERDSVEHRDFTWATFACNRAQMDMAKSLIRKFQDDLMAVLEEKDDADEVYRLAIQLFPLTKIQPDSKEKK